jgi:hypothetical protein
MFGKKKIFEKNPAHFNPGNLPVVYRLQRFGEKHPFDLVDRNIVFSPEKIGAIFDDREKTGFVEKEVVIDPQGEVNHEDLKRLIESLAR